MPVITTLELNEQQRRSVDNMKKLERSGMVSHPDDECRVLYTRLGINGNATGSGKTRAMIALIEELYDEREKRDITQVTSFGTHMHEEFKHELEYKPITVILANGSIRGQWVTELSASNMLRFKRIDNVRVLDSTDIDTLDVILVNPTVYKRLMDMNIHWLRFIYDEVDSFSIPRIIPLEASFTWFVTATWPCLQKFTVSSGRRIRTGLYRMLHGIELARIVVIDNEPLQDDIPPIEYIMHQFRPYTSLVQTVHDQIDSNIFIQIDAGDVRGAMTALGGECSSETLVDIVRRRITTSLEYARFQLNRGTNNELWSSRVQTLETDLQVVTNRFDQFLMHEHCSICTEHFNNPSLTPCQHVYCLECIVTWLRQSTTCPQCRARVEPSSLVTLVTQEQSQRQEDEDNEQHVERTDTNSRMDILERILVTNRQPDQRIIVFSEHDAAFDRLMHVLIPDSFSVLQGHSTTREIMLDAYKTGQKPILLLNSRTNGAGIDLPMTTDIILLHHMNDFIREQSIGRGQRLGRETPLRVHEFTPLF